jgi:GxxExxY protein
MANTDRLSTSQLNALSRIILLAAIEVHKEMGPGLLETVYQNCLVDEFRNRKLRVNTNVPVPLIYKGHLLNKDYVIDILVENEIILELKAIECILPVHEAQLISYLKLTSKQLGFLINFNVAVLKQGFKRFVNNLNESI